MHVREAFVTTVRRVVQDSIDAARPAQSDKRNSRVQLWHLTVELHTVNALPYTQSFDNCRVTIKFGNTTSVQLQRLLYFIMVQEHPPAEDVYVYLYTRDVMKRARESQVQRIDDKTIVDVIRS